MHLISEASDLAYADRDRYVADPDFVDVPTAGLLDPAYLAARSALIDPARHNGPASPGIPPGALARGDTPQPDLPSTSHFVVLDIRGNIVSMTTSVETEFGSNLMSGGFILNNQLTDFAFQPVVDGRKIANAPAPGKRPRSGMSPTIVFDTKGKPLVALGSPGGGRIIAYVVQTLIGVLDWQMPLQAAVSAPHHVSPNRKLLLEANTPIADLASALSALGHEVTVTPLTSGLQGIAFTAHGLEGAADPRREGAVKGLMPSAAPAESASPPAPSPVP